MESTSRGGAVSTSVSDTVSDTVTDTERDTIDLKDELDDIDEILATGSLSVAADTRRTGFIELALMSIANAIWAIVGLVLWLPRAARAVLWAVLKTVHSALTDQSSGRAVAGIKEVSRSYVERFLHRESQQAWVGRRHELRLFRSIAEAAWLVFFYLLLLRWLAPARFQPIWERIAAWVGAADATGRSALASAQTSVGEALASFEASRLVAAGGLLAAMLIGTGLGFWLGRRR